MSTQVERISIPDAELHYYPRAFTLDESTALLEILRDSIRWTSGGLMLYGRHIMMPRLIAWYGDPGITYEYSGQSSPHNDWTSDLLTIKDRVETLSRHVFNGALLNYYRDGRDSMSWHSDDEESLGVNPVIASVSFGATRNFRLRHRHDRSINPVNLSLTTGSLLIMRGQTQHYWQHQLPKTRKPVGGRINITFRRIKAPT